MNRTLILALLAASVLAQVPPAAASITPLLSEEQMVLLEAQVAANPTDIASRALLGKNYAYFILGVTELGDWDRVIDIDPAKAASEFATHARQQLAESTSASVCGEGGYALWNASFDVEGSLVAGPRAMGRIHADRTLAALAVDRAITLEPAAEKWHAYRARTLVVRARLNGGPQLSAAEAFLQIRQDMAALKGVVRDALLPTAARRALDAQASDEAGAYAREMLDKAKDTKDWYRGNLVFYGNMVLGQLALRGGDQAQAAEYLLASGQTPGSPQLNSFGPNMSLAKELIEAGYKEPVLQFFEECRLFWRGERGRLTAWAAQVNSEQMPNFRANLVY
ncbi:hypothetical protein [uncultured Paludibaculum sp.]|uniref:hypothetical protein n=1 Tax=uncultured Paludibaculum sp. TaxID=1765020 RepID=UPI002AAA79F1|nr:hypothetical protein [uncultured Paludibaculum sp.]